MADDDNHHRAILEAMRKRNEGYFRHPDFLADFNGLTLDEKIEFLFRATVKQGDDIQDMQVDLMQCLLDIRAMLHHLEAHPGIAMRYDRPDARKEIESADAELNTADKGRAN